METIKDMICPTCGGTSLSAMSTDASGRFLVECCACGAQRSLAAAPINASAHLLENQRWLDEHTGQVLTRQDFLRLREDLRATDQWVDDGGPGQVESRGGALV